MFRRGPRTGGVPSLRGARGGSGSYARGGARKTGGGGGQQKRGAFLNGSWHCDCDPRLPAEHFRVKKDGPNHGRWFYTCQAAQDERCGFFLWEDDAAPRMEAAVLSAARTEPGKEAEAAALGVGGPGQGAAVAATTSMAKPAPSAVQSLGDGQANPLWVQQSQASSRTGSSTQGSSTILPAATKRKLGDGDQSSGQTAKRQQVIQLDGSETEGEDEFGDGDELLSWPPTAQPPQTPRKQTGGSSTAVSGLATPQTTKIAKPRRLPWMDYSAEDEDDTEDPAPPATPSKASATLQQLLPTPSQTKLKTTITPPPDSDRLDGQQQQTKPTLQDEVQALVAAHVPNPDQQRALREALAPVLSRHELRLRGVDKGRELVRAALRARELRVVEMQGRIAGLEAEREVLLAAVGRAREESELL